MPGVSLIDVVFTGPWLFHSMLNGVGLLQQHDQLGLLPGFFLQAVASAWNEEDFVGLPRPHRQRWLHQFSRTPRNYAVEGDVFVVSQDRPFAMDGIPLHDRLQAVNQRWPWLTGGPLYIPYIYQRHYVYHLGDLTRARPSYNIDHVKAKLVYWDVYKKGHHPGI